MSFSEIDIIDKIATHERSIHGVNYSYLGAQNPGGKPNVPGVLHLSPHFLCRQIAFNNEWKNFAEITSYLLVCPREAYGGKLSKIESLAIPFGERWRNKFQDRNTIAEISRDLPRVLLLELSSAKYRTDIEHDGIAWVGWEFTFNVEYQEIGNMTRSFFYNVTDYGAIGDGAADDTAAIQLAINMAENGGIVAIPPGTYRITSSLTFQLNTDYPFAARQTKWKAIWQPFVSATAASQFPSSYKINLFKRTSGTCFLVLIYHQVYQIWWQNCTITQSFLILFT